MRRELWTAADGSAVIDETATGRRLRLLVRSDRHELEELELVQLLDADEAAQLGSALVAWALEQHGPATPTIPGQLKITPDPPEAA